MCKATISSSSCIKAEVSKWFRFFPSPSLESAVNKEDDEAILHKKVKITDPATQAAIETLWVLLSKMRTVIHGVLEFLFKFQTYAKVITAYLVTQQEEMEEMETIL